MQEVKAQDRPTATAVQAKCEVIGSLLRPPYLAEARLRGFASMMEGNTLTQDEQRAKLQLVGRVAGSVYG